MKKTLQFIPLFAVVFLFGCATHTSESENARKSWAMGNTQAAEKELAAKAKDNLTSGDSLIWTLEHAAAARANRDLQASISEFARAHEAIEVFESEPDVKLIEEASAIFTNQSYIPYKGYNYDKIMIGAYQALNYMELKDFDNAAVELKRLENFQRNAEQLNQSRIDREANALKEANAKNKNGGYDASKTLSDPAAQRKLHEVYGDDYIANTSEMEAKLLYVNPFAYWLSGVFFMNKAEDSSDKNRAADFFRLASDMLGNKSEFILSDLKVAEDFANGTIQNPPNITYVIYETGMAPIRKQIRIDLPLYIIQGDIPHISINFPYLKKEDSFAPTLNIATADSVVKTELLADMDAIVRREFNDLLPSIITKSIISTAVKAGAQYGVKQAAGNGWAGLATNVAFSVYQATMNDADLRTWTTLPKQIQIARIETPADGLLVIGNIPVRVNPESTNIILAKRMAAESPLHLRKFNFSDKKDTPTANNSSDTSYSSTSHNKAL